MKNKLEKYLATGALIAASILPSGCENKTDLEEKVNNSVTMTSPIKQTYEDLELNKLYNNYSGFLKEIHNNPSLYVKGISETYEDLSNLKKKSGKPIFEEESYESNLKRISTHLREKFGDSLSEEEIKKQFESGGLLSFGSIGTTYQNIDLNNLDRKQKKYLERFEIPFLQSSLIDYLPLDMEKYFEGISNPNSKDKNIYETWKIFQKFGILDKEVSKKELLLIEGLSRPFSW